MAAVLRKRCARRKYRVSDPAPREMIWHVGLMTVMSAKEARNESTKVSIAWVRR